MQVAPTTAGTTGGEVPDPPPPVDGSQLRGASHRLVDRFFIDRVLEKLARDTTTADRPALLFKGATVTFCQLNERADRLARRLTATLSGRPSNSDGDTIVAVCLDPGIDLIATLLAVFKAGAAYLPLDASFPADRLLYIVNDARPALLVTTADLLVSSPALSRLDPSAVTIFDVEAADTGGDADTEKSDGTIESDDDGREDGALASVLYTSGSTGSPKGVRLRHSNIQHRLAWQWRRFPYGPGDVACFKTALTFVDSIAEIWAPLLMAVPVVVVPKSVSRNTELFVDLLDQCGVTRLVLVPSLLSAILTDVQDRCRKSPNAQPPLSQLHLWVCSGEILTAELLLRFYDSLPSTSAGGNIICNLYGSTEVTGDVTYTVFHSRQQVLESLVDGKVPIGVPLDNNAVYLLDSAKKLVPTGHIGELYVAGGHVAAGYVNQREMGRFGANTVDDRVGYGTWFKTGDFGRLIGSVFVFEGRSDSQVKIRGYRVDLAEVDHVLSQIQEVQAGVVLCYKPGEPEQELVAFVVTTQTDVSIIKDRLKEKLLPYMIPQVMEIDALPLLVNGKVDRQKLLSMFSQRSQDSLSEDTEHLVVDEDQLNVEERALLKTVASVVSQSSQKPIRLTDNFFEVGGNSLNTVTVVSRLRDQGFHLDVASFLSAATLAEIVPVLKQPFPAKAQYDQAIEQLQDSAKEQVIRIISTSFSKKADLELLTGVTYEDVHAFMNELWDPLVAAGLSFVVKNDAGRISAVSLNFDVFDEPAIPVRVQRMAYVFDFLESIEAPVREAHFEKKTNQLIHSFMMGTDAELSPAENVALIQLMEQETLKLAKSRGFIGVFTTNTNELTRQICDNILDYRVLSEVRVNQYVHADGTRPFAAAPDTQLSVVTVKFVDN